MPNWCHNTLTVEGPAEELQRFAHAVRSDEQPLSFATLVPEPDGLMEREDLGMAGLIDAHLPDDRLDWYSWRCRRWGSKWDAHFETPFVALGDEDSAVSEPAGLLDLGESLTYAFLTAWSPPEPFCLQASVQFPALRFTLTYAEPGNDFAGRLVLGGGQPLDQDELAVEDVLGPEDRWF